MEGQITAGGVVWEKPFGITVLRPGPGCMGRFYWAEMKENEPGNCMECGT